MVDRKVLGIARHTSNRDLESEGQPNRDYNIFIVAIQTFYLQLFFGLGITDGWGVFFDVMNINFG